MLLLALAHAGAAGAAMKTHRRSCAAAKAGRQRAHGAQRSCRGHRTRAQRRAVRSGARSHTRTSTRHARRHRVHSPSESAGSEAISASIATVLATPCTNTALTPEPSNLPLVRAAVLCLINRKRAENGEPPLLKSADLEAAAESHASELIAEDYFAHVAPERRDARRTDPPHRLSALARTTATSSARTSPGAPTSSPPRRPSPKPGSTPPSTSPTSSNRSTAKPASPSSPPCPRLWRGAPGATRARPARHPLTRGSSAHIRARAARLLGSTP